jgi:hypothetical protein
MVRMAKLENGGDELSRILAAGMYERESNDINRSREGMWFYDPSRMHDT